MDRYLSKPFSIDQLFSALESCVPEATGTAAAAASATSSSLAAIPVLTTRVAPAQSEAPAAVPAQAAESKPTDVPAKQEPPAAANAGVAVLDEQTLDQIRQLQRGVPNLLSKVAELYLENSAALLDELRSCLHRRDFAGMAKGAHALKSTSANAGAKHLAGICAALEDFALQSKFEESRNALSEVIQEHERVARALDALRVAA